MCSCISACPCCWCRPPFTLSTHPPSLQMVEVFMPQYLPMLVPPVPWLRNNMGGHLTLRNTGKATAGLGGGGVK